MKSTEEFELSEFVVQNFIAQEAALLDDCRFEEWLTLFSPDAYYWVPLMGSRQLDPFSQNSIAYEDTLLLRLRVERLKNPRAHSQHPPSRASTFCSCRESNR